MELRKKLESLMDIIFVIALSLTCLYFSKTSLIFIGIIPILYAIFYFKKGGLRFILAVLATYLIGLIFSPGDKLVFSFLPLIIIGISLIILIGLKFSDKVQIVAAFIIISLVFIFLYKYKMVEEKLTIETLAIDLKENFEGLYPYNFDSDLYKMVIALYPAVIGSISLLYAILSIKLIRNYLAYKGFDFTDMDGLDKMRIGSKEFFIILIIEVLIYYLLGFLAMEKTYILGNLMLINFTIFAINGFGLFAYKLKDSKLPLSRAFKWFLILVFLEILIIPFAIFGLLDVFVDFRARRKYEK